MQEIKQGWIELFDYNIFNLPKIVKKYLKLWGV